MLPLLVLVTGCGSLEPDDDEHNGLGGIKISPTTLSLLPTQRGFLTVTGIYHENSWAHSRGLLTSLSYLDTAATDTSHRGLSSSQWFSSDTALVEVQRGIVEAKSCGTADVYVESEGVESEKITVNVGLYPQADYFPPALAFGAENTYLPLAITNSAYGELTWKIEEDIQWIRVEPTSGVGDTTVDVFVSKHNLPAGTHSGSISLLSDGGNARIPVSVTVEEPFGPLLLVEGYPEETVFKADDALTGRTETGSRFTLNGLSVNYDASTGAFSIPVIHTLFEDNMNQPNIYKLTAADTVANSTTTITKEVTYYDIIGRWKGDLTGLDFYFDVDSTFSVPLSYDINLSNLSNSWPSGFTHTLYDEDIIHEDRGIISGSDESVFSHGDETFRIKTTIDGTFSSSSKCSGYVGIVFEILLNACGEDFFFPLLAVKIFWRGEKL